MSTYNSDHIIESTKELALYSGWGILKEYMSDMEDYLHETTEAFESDINEQKKTLTPEQLNQFHIDHVWDYVYYYDEFPYILRNSFFLSAYALFEVDRGMIRRMLRKAKQKPSELSPPIDNYSKLRNCIAHTNGSLKENDRDYKTLIENVKKKGLIKERFIISTDAPELEIGLTQKFCEEVVETMQNFILAACEASLL